MMGSTTSQQLKLNAVNSNKKYCREEKDELIVHGYIHQEVNDTDIILFPAALIDLCLIFYHIKCEILKWSKTWKTEGLQLIDDDKCLSDQSSIHKTKLKGYKYALCDTIPIKTGKICWRFEIKNPLRYWFSTCIAKPNQQYPNAGTSKHGVYGVGTDPNWYPYGRTSATRWTEGHDRHSGNWSQPNKDIAMAGKYHIDMLFDADIGVIEFCVVEDNKLSAKVWGVPINSDDGYVPHFNTISLTKCEIRIARIYVECYGEKIENMFESM